MTSSDSFFYATWQSIRANIVPGLCLQAIAVLLLLLFYFAPGSQGFFQIFAGLKIQYGRVYAILATALFGGLIPFIYLWASGGITGHKGKELGFYVLFWAWRGWEIDVFYTAQGVLFGNAPTVSVIATKVLVDQLIYSALWAAPVAAICYAWKNAGFSLSRLRAGLNRSFFMRQLPTVIISNWLVWFPACAMIYTLPAALQVPMFNLVLCFWVLMLAVLNRRRT